ncbi:MAG TPA: malto-oligosyltrehalose trehalohydrolase [Thermoanaerobaculia bacterium]|nr:malto-oligosyltrehalose trehalohydrolase [Thermoanaerobaculia bacterium]
MPRAIAPAASTATATRRRLPIGAEPTVDGTSFRLWAPARQRIEVVIESGGEGRYTAHELAPEPDGYFSGDVAGVGAGTRYWLRLDGERTIPDPASRFQPEGPEGPSEVVDPARFRWTDSGWRGPQLLGQVLYELHLGTFTPEGTYRAAATRLPYLRDLGVTTVELMPIAEFPGEFGWGYDGVDLFAPARLYGRPDELRAFVDAAHGHGIAVILDVVYNHFGPRGNFLRELSPHYFTDRHENEWGDAIDFDGPHSTPVRELVLANVEHWIAEYHLDGLRLDATQNIHDASPEHLVAAIARRARAAAGERRVLLFAENEPQEARYLAPADAGGYGIDGMWNDDFHHSAVVAATGRAEAYLSPYRGTAAELLAAVKWGFLYQGQVYPWQEKRRGTPSFGIAAPAFVCCLENHDQVANSARGRRLHQATSPGRLRALTALLLLAPETPLLFQGQEFASSAPFLYFADHPPELAKQVRAGRTEFLSQFARFEDEDPAAVVPDPASPTTFAACKLDWSEREKNAGTLALHRDLLRMRRAVEIFRRQDARRLDGAVLGEQALVLRFFAALGEDRLLVVNLGRDLPLGAAPEPLLAPPAGRRWRTAWSSESFAYGGAGTPPLDRDGFGWWIPGETAVVLEGIDDGDADRA